MVKSTKMFAFSPEACKIKWVREQLGLSQEQLAERVGVSRATLNGWESGRNRVPPVKFARFCKIMDANFDGYKEPIEYDDKGYPLSFNFKLLKEYNELEIRIIEYWVDASTPEKPDRMVLADDADSEAYYAKVQEAQDAYYESLARVEGVDFVHRSLERARIEKTGYKRFLNPRDNEEKRNQDILYLKRVLAKVKASHQ